MTIEPPTALSAAIHAELQSVVQRTQRIELQGKVYWLKRLEQPGALRRLQKGNPAAAFERERAALHWCADRGLPMPPILYEGEDWFLLPDSGIPIERLMSGPDADFTAFAAAGTALAQLHARGVSHGRPALKDICWCDERITFIDLENFRFQLHTPKGHARDLIIFALNGFALGDGPSPAMQAALQSYRIADTSGVWAEAQSQCERLRWLNWLTKPIQIRKPGKAKEFKAIPYVLELFS